MSVNTLRNSKPSSAPYGTNTYPPAPQQIRFVSTDGQPHAKRRRISAACLTCRRRKTRCTGERPVCTTCRENGHDCAGYVGGLQRKSSISGKQSEGEEESDSSSSPGKRLPRIRVEAGPARSSQVQSTPTMQSYSSGDSAASMKAVDIKSPESNYTTGSTATTHNRIPYFRYFGPTAIVPGFKQMVVQVKDHQRSVNPHSGDSPAFAATGATPAGTGRGTERAPTEIPFYDATDPTRNAPLITELCETFFTHLGCNYPFLQRDRFMKDLEEKRVDAILVDAVCGVAARFSSHSILSAATDQSIPVDAENQVQRAFRGHPFTQRAMSAVVDTFPCPTIAVAQACLLLAYEEFGTDHDSGLWMYLGTSIRMAQDLGIQKLEGMQLEGRIGPTPKTAKKGSVGQEEERRRAAQQQKLSKSHRSNEPVPLEDRRASEQERIDTFYAIFFLDRAVSSGVGRPVTLRDKDIEIAFPYRPDQEAINGWPDPFPTLIRIVHMYGRVADVLNNIKEIDQVTPEVLKRLAGMEKDLTGIYQRLSTKLYFNATNFQHYVKHEQGTNFILLHFWFHTLIVMLHQPTLLHSFEGRIQQLFPDSRELSMSSAKTIADILAFAELIDIKSFIGNPFTSQPMYIAACAFLAEAASHASQPASRDITPPSRSSKTTKSDIEEAKSHFNRKHTAKYTLLAAAANQNYQRCYKALQMLHSYWAGCRYILTALDQKCKGLMDPLLFTRDDLDGEMPSTKPSFTTPGWRRSMSNSASMGGPVGTGALRRLRNIGGGPNAAAWSPSMGLSQAIGWSLTGTTDSLAPNLSFLYQANNKETGEKVVQSGRQPARQNGEDTSWKQTSESNGMPTAPLQGSSSLMAPPPTRQQYPDTGSETMSAAEADMILGLQSPYSTNRQPHPNQNQQLQSPLTSISNPGQSYDYAPPPTLNQMSQFYSQPNHPYQPSSTPGVHANFGDMMIESQDIDMSDPQGGGFAFPGRDMIPWLEYLPPDVLSYFGEANQEDMGGLSRGPGEG